MTGVGSARGETEVGPLAVEIRSVNGKGFTAKLRLPAELGGRESEIDALLRERVRRGSLVVVVEAGDGSGTSTGTIDVRLAEAAALELEALRKRLGLSGSVELSHVLAVPGELRGTGVTARVSAVLPPGVRALLSAALDALLQHREVEGRATVLAMRKDLAQIGTQLRAVNERWPQVLTEHRRRLLERVNEFLATRAAALEPSDIVHEVAMFADKVDVGEEVQRLTTHLGKAETMLQQGGEIGRALEFLLQEILREVNTLGSKVPDVVVSHAVVEMKLAIERLKEQAQNLE